jgi:hypothetical protein
MLKTRGSSTYKVGVKRYIKCPNKQPWVEYGAIGKKSDAAHIYTMGSGKRWRYSRPPKQNNCSHVISDIDVDFPYYERYDMYGQCIGGYGKQVITLEPNLGSTKDLRKYDNLIFDAMVDAKSKGTGTYDLLQYKQTFKTISDCVFKSKRFLLMKVPGDEGKSLQHRIADRWLEYRYALNPLISTADAQIKAAIDSLHGGPTYVKGKAAAMSDGDEIISMGYPPKYANYGILHFSTRYKEISKAYCWYEAGKMQLNFNPAVAIWDKIPWSFVVNWFVDVESLLWNLSPTLGFTYHSGSVSTNREVDASLDSIEKTFKSLGKDRITFNVGGGYYKMKFFNRTVFEEEPSYNFALEVCNPVKWQRCLDVLALLTGRTSRRSR